MKKQNLLKLAFTMMAMIVMTGAWAQPWTGQTTVGKYNQSTRLTTYVGYDYTVDTLTVGKTMPFWVWPSAVYNPDFVTTGFDGSFPTQAQIENNINSTFAWKTVNPGADDAATATALSGATALAGFAKNYVELAVRGDAGTQLVEVIETAPSVSCSGDPIYFGFTAIATPSVAIDASGAPAAGLGLTNTLSRQCWGAADDHLYTIALTNNNTLESSDLHVVVTYKAYTVDNLNASGEIPNTAGEINVGDVLVNEVASTTITGADGSAVPSTTNPIVVTTKAASSDLVASQDYPLIAGKITVYEIESISSNGKISRKSDYLARRAGTLSGAYGFSYYNNSDNGTKYYIVSLPQPVTGPIYHIANNFAY